MNGQNGKQAPNLKQQEKTIKRKFLFLGILGDARYKCPPKFHAVPNATRVPCVARGGNFFPTARVVKKNVNAKTLQNRVLKSPPPLIDKKPPLINLCEEALIPNSSEIRQHFFGLPYSLSIDGGWTEHRAHRYSIDTSIDSMDGGHRLSLSSLQGHGLGIDKT